MLESIKRSRRGLWALGLAAVIGLASPPADACGNDIVPVENEQVSSVKRARTALNAGRYGLAASLLRRAFPAIADASPEKDHVVAGALRVMALVTVRSGGLVSPHRKAKEPEENLAWAVATLRRINEHRKNEPWRQTDLAEALASLPEHKDEARKLLEELAKRGLVATAEGYATLAKLRGEAGDKAGRDAALASCKTMTLTPARCTNPRA